LNCILDFIFTRDSGSLFLYPTRLLKYLFALSCVLLEAGNVSTFHKRRLFIFWIVEFRLSVT